MSTRTKESRLTEKGKKLAKLTAADAINRDRRREARDKYRKSSLVTARKAVQLAEAGYPWPDVVLMSGVTASFARLVVLGTD
jgi:hypothetical protein